MDDKNFEPYMKINAIVDPSPLQLLFYNIVTKYNMQITNDTRGLIERGEAGEGTLLDKFLIDITASIPLIDISYQRYLPCNVPEDRWPKSLNAGKSGEAYDLAFVPFEKLTKLNRQDLSNLINDQSIYPQYFKIDSNILGIYDFEVLDNKLSLIDLCTYTSITEGCEQEIFKNIVLQYAELFYTPLKNNPANAFYESDCINPNYKSLLTPYIDRIGDLDPNDILADWADIFGYNIDYLKFLELFSRFSIKEVQRIKEGIK